MDWTSDWPIYCLLMLLQLIEQRGKDEIQMNKSKNGAETINNSSSTILIEA